MIRSISRFLIASTVEVVLGLREGEVAYIRVAAVDNWGGSGLNISGQFTVTGKSVDLASIQAELDALAVTLAAAQVDIDAAEAAIVVAQGQISTLNTNLGTTNSNLALRPDRALTQPSQLARSPQPAAARAATSQLAASDARIPGWLFPTIRRQSKLSPSRFSPARFCPRWAA